MNRLSTLLLSLTMLLITLASDSFAAFPARNQKVAAANAVASNNVVVNAQEQRENKISLFKKVRSEHGGSVYGIFSLLSLVLGAVGLLVAFFSGAGFVLGLVAVIFGAIGLYMGSERMFATLGIIFGAVAILVALLI